MNALERLERAHARLRALESDPRARNLELQLCARDPAYWLWNDQMYVWTRDEYDPVNPVKPFPDEPGLRDVLNEIHLGDQQVTCLGKSRQLTVTWLVVAYFVWWARFVPNQLLFIQSKKEEDAANLVFNKESGMGRASFIENNLPKWMQTDLSVSYGVILYPNGSKLWGIPQGGDIIRSYTGSGLFSDEAAFQPFAREAYRAAKACCRKIVMVSSAEGGSFFGQLSGFEIDQTGTFGGAE
jgi:hypothetical protein